MSFASLRGRLLAAFVLVAVPPLLLLAVAISSVLSGSFERNATGRLEGALATAERRLADLRKQAAVQVAEVARKELSAPAPSAEADRTLATAIAERRNLAALEILDPEGRIISSHHWPAGFNLPDRDDTFPADDTLRIEKVAEGYGSADRLAVMASQAASWRGAPVLVRGGPFVDRDFLADLSALMGVEVAFRDTARRRWIAAPASPFLAWPEPALRGPGERGEVALGGTAYRWAGAPVNGGLWLVVATPRTAESALRTNVRSLTLAVTAAALLAALWAALLLSGRIARPVHELAEGARRVASGDLEGAVPSGTRDEIGQLASAFNAMTAELRSSRERVLQAERVAAWREMARRLAHELKNPIFPIQLSIETLRRAFEQRGARDPALPGGFARLFADSSDTILEELRSLRKIIEEFSEFARMPRPELRPVDVNEVAEQVLSLYQARAEDLRIEKALASGLPAVPADRDLLSRALGNLIANALEAMPAGGTLHLRTAPHTGGVSIDVGDTGPGLTEEQRTRLFTPYYTTKKGGTGLGLAIVQGVVSDHGGRIEVRSEPGHGTTFTLFLPGAASDGFREKL